MILERVGADAVVRSKISQSSALRQKRGHKVVNPDPCCLEPKCLVGLNNNGPVSYTEQNGLVQSKDATTECLLLEMKGLKGTDEQEEESSVSTDTLSEVSKFESQLTLIMSQQLYLY